MNAGLQPFLMWLDSAIASGIEKMNQPVSGAQDAASQVKNFGIRVKSGMQEIGELFPAGKLKILNRNTIKLMARQRFKSFLQAHGVSQLSITNYQSQVSR